MLTHRNQYYGWRKNDLYTLHPKDTPNWTDLHTFEQYTAYNDEGKKKEDSVNPLPTAELLPDWRAHWQRENPPTPSDTDAEKEAEAAEDPKVQLVTVRLEKGEQEYEDNSAMEAGELADTDEDLEDIYNSDGEEPDIWDWSEVEMKCLFMGG